LVYLFEHLKFIFYNLLSVNRSFCLIIFIHSVIVCSAQQARQHVFAHFTTVDGLASNIVNNVVQDDKGFIWLATIDGLQRYDGNKFITFRTKSSNRSSVPGDRISKVFKDEKGNLWLWAKNKVGTFNTTNFTFHQVPIEGDDEKRPFFIKFFTLNDNGDATLFIPEKGIYVLDEKKGKFVPAGLFTLPRKWEVSDMYHSYREPDYLFACDSGFVVYNIKTGHINYRHYNKDKHQLINQIRHETGGATIYKTEKNLVIYSTRPQGQAVQSINILNTRTGKRNRFVVNPKSKSGYYELRGVFEQQNGRLWLYGRDFIGFYQDGQEFLTLISHGYQDEQSTKFDEVYNMYEDRQHNIWTSTKNGVYMFNPDGELFNSYYLARPEEPKTIEGVVYTACQLKDTKIFIGTEGNGLYCYDKNFNPLPLPKALIQLKNANSVRYIYQHSTTHLVWMSLPDGRLLIYNPSTDKAELVTHEVFEHSVIRQIAEDNEGNLWFGLDKGQVVKWDIKLSGRDVRKGYVKIKEADGAYIHKIYCDSRGYVWVASLSYGLYKFNAVTNRQEDHIKKEGPKEHQLWNNSPDDILQYNDSLLLIACGAINILNTKTNKLSLLNAESGLPSNTVYCLEKDAKGTLWLGLAQGLCRLVLEKNMFSKYDRRDGIAYDNFNPAGVYKLRDGRLIYTTDRNFVVLDPSKVENTSKPPNPVITDFKLANKSLSVDSLEKLKKINLRYDNTSLLIEFNSLTYIQQNKIHYRYKLEGIDKDWQETTDLNQAVYNYLPADEYTFMVRAENSDGIPSNDRVILQIGVTPPFWRTWWFFGIIAFILGAFFYYIDFERIKRLHAMQRMRTQIAHNLHDDVEATLNSISLLSEMAKIKVDKDTQLSKEFIEQIHTKSRRMMDAMSDMLWSLNPENDTMEKTILRMRQFAEDLQTTYDTNIQLEVDTKVNSVKLDMKKRHEFFLIFKEALHNIATQCNGAASVINIDFIRGKLLLKIHNPKAAFTPPLVAQTTEEEMKQRANFIGAQLEIQSDKKGVAVILAVPVNKSF
jgi:ligand-binding sensor domain-containing protein